MGFCFDILFSHSQGVQPKLNRALAGEARLPGCLRNWPRAPQVFLVLIHISERERCTAPCDLRCFSAWQVLRCLSAALLLSPPGKESPPIQSLTSIADSTSAKLFKDSERQIAVSYPPTPPHTPPHPHPPSSSVSPPLSSLLSSLLPSTSSLSPPACSAVALSESSEFPVHCSVSAWKRHRCRRLVHYKKQREKKEPMMG